MAEVTGDNQGFDWMNALKMGGGVLGAGYGLYNMIKGSQGGQQSAYNIDALRAEQQPFMDQYNQIYGQGQNQYQTGQGYMDAGGEQNQLLRRSLMGNLMNSQAVTSMINNRNPYTSSGILQAQNQDSRQDMMGMANNQFMQGLQGNMKFGAGLMGQGIQTQMGATQGGAGLAENIQQGMIANQDIANTNSYMGSQNRMDMGQGLFKLMSNFIG